jgi:hypothetical protein
MPVDRRAVGPDRSLRNVHADSPELLEGLAGDHDVEGPISTEVHLGVHQGHRFVERRA